MTSPFLVDRGQPQLFVDDLLIEEAENLRRTLHRPRKDNDGNAPVIALPKTVFGEKPAVLMADGTIVFDPKLNSYVMFALCFSAVIEHASPEGWGRVKVLRFTSPDGLAWSDDYDVIYPCLREDMEVGPAPDGVLSGDLFSCHYDKSDPDHPYQGWFFLRGGEEETGLYHMRSSDGVRWERGKQVVQRFCREIPQDGKTLIGPGDVSVFCPDTANRRYLASFKFQGRRGKGNEHLLRSRAYMFVDRLDEPIDMEQLEHVDQVPPQCRQDGNEPEDEYYGSTAWRYGSHWLGGLKVFHTQGDYPWSSAGCAFLKFQSSRDGLHWEKTPFDNDEGTPEIFIPNGEEGAYNGGSDGGYITEFTNPPLQIDNELVLYYGCSSWGKNHPRGVRVTGGGVFRARLRLDGFVSVDGGSLTTRPFTFRGGGLYVNHAGPVEVEVLRAGGECLARERFDGDDLGRKQQKTFQGTPFGGLLGDPPDLSPLRLRFRMGDGGRLYSFIIR